MTAMMLPSRRDILRWGAAGAAALALPGVLAARQAKKIGLGVQLYSVRDFCGKDFDGTLKQIAEMGFEGVEFAGYHQYKDNPAGLKKKLDELGLKAAGTHIGANSFFGDALKKTVEFHKAIGCAFLICPGDGRFTKAADAAAFADQFNKAADALKAEGMACGFHNHTAEFGKAEGDKTWWDLFVERTSKDVVLQVDFGHALYAGVDCVGLVKKAPGRVRTTHVKGRLPKGTQGKKPFVGQDTGDWKSILGACYEVGGTDWFLIEQEDYPDGKSSMECTKISLDGLRGILKEMGK
jgi:sugar phosphate isomerase/epimerase